MLHLFHPALIHFPVAFIVAGGATEVWAILAGREPARRWGASLVLVGLICLVPAIASGYLAANTLDVPRAYRSLLEAHERIAWLLLGVLFAAQFWKAWCGGRVPARLRWIYVLLMVVSILLAGYGAWLGGRMVYGGGIGIV